MYQCDKLALKKLEVTPMCINNFRNLMRVEDEKCKGAPPGLAERVFYWVLAKLRQRMAG